MQTNQLPNLETVAAKFLLLIFASVLIAAVVVTNFPWIFATNLNSQRVVISSMLVGGNFVAWVLLALGMLKQNNLKILYFLFGVSFKTLVILLVVQQLKTGGEGYLQFQVVIFFATLSIILLATAFSYKRMFGFK